MYVLTYILDSPTHRSQLSVLDVPCKRRSERGGGAFPTKLCRIKSAFLAALVRVSWACWDPLIMTWNLYHGIFILEPRDVERKRGRGTRAHCHFRESTRGPETGSCRAGDQEADPKGFKPTSSVANPYCYLREPSRREDGKEIEKDEKRSDVPRSTYRTPSLLRKSTVALLRIFLPLGKSTISLSLTLSGRRPSHIDRLDHVALVPHPPCPRAPPLVAEADSGAAGSVRVGGDL